MKLKDICIISYALMAFVGCQELEQREDGLLLTGTENDNLVKFAIDEQESYAISVTSTACVEQDVMVNLEMKPELLADYNKRMNTNYSLPPINSCELENSQVVIPAGQSISSTALLKIVNREDFVDGAKYVVPVSIASVGEGGMNVLESGRTIFLKLSKTLTFAAPYVGNTRMSRLFKFENSTTGVRQYTWEVKFKAENFNKSTIGEPIRVCSTMGNMLRFGEAGNPGNILEVYDSGDKMIAKTEFATGTWYLLSVVNDGKMLTLYVNGKKDCSMNISSFQERTFSEMELGMTTSGYESKQLFHGWLGGIRVWSRALSAREINAGVCGVDPNSSGLEAYWSMDENEGYTYYDKSPFQRHIVYPSSQWITWDNDNGNKCIE